MKPNMCRPIRPTSLPPSSDCFAYSMTVGGVSDADSALHHNVLCCVTKHRGQRPLLQIILGQSRDVTPVYTMSLFHCHQCCQSRGKSVVLSLRERKPRLAERVAYTHPAPA